VFKVYPLLFISWQKDLGIMVKETTRHRYIYGPYSSAHLQNFSQPSHRSNCGGGGISDCFPSRESQVMSIISITREGQLKCRQHLPWTRPPFGHFSFPDRSEGVSRFTDGRMGAGSALHIWSGPARSGPCVTLPNSTVRTLWM